MAFIVAIDGPVAAGKGTIAKEIAKTYRLSHLDTGLLYRAVARILLDRGIGIDAEAAAEIARAIAPDDISRTDLRTPEVSAASSEVAALPDVRKALVCYQREFAHRDGGAVLDGRDIGTVICPDADVKLFVTASDEVRARRRFDELSRTGSDRAFKDVLADLRLRDKRDTERKTAALKSAADAVLIDTSKMTILEAVNKAVAAIDARISTGRGP